MKRRPIKQLERKLKIGAINLLAFACSSRVRDRSALESQLVERILVVRPHNERGDMLLMVPLLRAVRTGFPRAEVTLLASTVNGSVMMRNPFIDRLLMADLSRLRRRPWEWLALVRRLRALKPELALLPHTVSYSVTSALLTRLSGAPLRLGSDSRSFGHRASSVALNLVVPHPTEEMHETERNLSLLRWWGIGTHDLSPLYITSSTERAGAADFMRNLSTRDARVMLHVGAGKEPNRWPAEYFGRLARRVIEDAGGVVVLTAGPGEEALLQRARAMIGEDGEPASSTDSKTVAVLQGRTLGELAAVAEQMSLYVGNDTGPLHLVAGVSTPTLALLGPTNPDRWLPRTPRSHFLSAPSGALALLTVETVWSRVRAILGGSADGETP